MLDNAAVIGGVAAFILAIASGIGIVVRAWGARASADLVQDVSSTQQLIKELSARVGPLETLVETLQTDLAATRRALVLEQARQARVVQRLVRIIYRQSDVEERLIDLIKSDPQTSERFATMIILNTNAVRTLADALQSESLDATVHAPLDVVLTQVDGDAKKEGA